MSCGHVCSFYWISYFLCRLCWRTVNIHLLWKAHHGLWQLLSKNNAIIEHRVNQLPIITHLQQMIWNSKTCQRKSDRHQEQVSDFKFICTWFSCVQHTSLYTTSYIINMNRYYCSLQRFLVQFICHFQNFVQVVKNVWTLVSKDSLLHNMYIIIAYYVQLSTLLYTYL